MNRALSKVARRLRGNEAGNVAILFALSVFPLAFFVGAAVDYSRATLLRANVARAADAATLFAATQTRAQIAAGSSDGKAISAARKAAQNLYESMLPPSVSAKDATIDIRRQGIAISATLVHQTVSPNVFMGILGQPSIPVSADSSAKATLPPYVDVALLVDASGSMAIGADDAAVKTLVAKTGCAFACHDGVPVMGTQMDAYQWAVSQGITLRTQAVNAGIVAFLDYLQTKDPSNTLHRVALYSFADALTKLSAYSTNLTAAKNSLPQQTNAASELTAATHFTEIMPAFTLEVGSSGDGASQLSPKKLVIIATDGVQDPNRTWTWNLPLRAQVRPFDPAACAALKTAGVSVGVIHTPYVPMTWDWGYNATLGQPSQIGGSGTREEDIAGQLQKCASPGMYTTASSSTVAAAFQSLFEAFVQTRIVK